MANFVKLKAIYKLCNFSTCTRLFLVTAWSTALLPSTTSAEITCHNWNPGARATLKLQNKNIDRLTLWSNSYLNRRIVTLLSHDTKIRVISQNYGCGGAVYIEAKYGNRTDTGWVNADRLADSIK
jgi:hypothetical protein